MVDQDIDPTPDRASWLILVGRFRLVDDRNQGVAFVGVMRGQVVVCRSWRDGAGDRRLLVYPTPASTVLRVYPWPSGYLIETG